jgi:dynein heavy chain 1
VFTGVLRSILNNVRGESKRRHWIVFDGDVDPEWAENLNSVLDDNRLLTLPSGERLAIPDNVRLMFEVHSLRHATLATVSRCGMVWFSDDVVSMDMVLREQLAHLRQGTVGAGAHSWSSGEPRHGAGAGSVDAADGASLLEAASLPSPGTPAAREQSLDQMVRMCVGLGAGGGWKELVGDAVREVWLENAVV